MNVLVKIIRDNLLIKIFFFIVSNVEDESGDEGEKVIVKYRDSFVELLDVLRLEKV